MTATATKSTKTPPRFTERSYFSGAKHAAKIDREAGVIQGVRVIGFESKNRRRYPKATLEKALPLYDGVDVNLDHELMPMERSIVDGFGVLRNPTLREDGIYADLHYLKSHSATPQILEMAERFPGNFGLSHVATGAFTKAKDGWDEITEIQAVESVDIVRKPATNAGLFESVRRRRKLRDVLAGLGESNSQAKGLATLLESDPFADFADLPVEAPMASDPVEQPDEAADALAAGLEAMVVAILKQDIPVADKADRITQVLTAGDAPASGEVDTEGGTDEGDDGMSQQTKQPPATPAQASKETPAADVQKKVESLERSLAIRQLYDDVGLSPRDLTEAQRKLVEEQTTLDNAKALIETYKAARPAPAPATDRPNVKRAVPAPAPVGETEKYEDVLAEAKSATSRSRQRV